ncbi:MAG: chemotaxis protein CheW [Hassallia sp. WJT32-NPBG1]|jgi:purine-binding chemotaxis protein CheW|nr:chemotaxis protein CheW [Hassallia sp. WJT32-NPBG1]
MKEHSYLIFSLDNYLYGISLVYVEEIFSLPELTLLSQEPREIVGVVNVRGNIVPVMYLNFSFGYQSLDYRLTDSLVVLKWEQFRLGIIVNQAYEVRNISPEEITTQLDYERELAVVEPRKIITGVARIPVEIFILSNPENWLDYLEKEQVLSFENFLKEEILYSHNANQFQPNGSELFLSQQPVFCPNATLEERRVFRKRADNLRLPPESQDLKTFITLAVIALNGHLFGIDLAMVREFTDIRKVTPIPCVKSHIIGNMNLRGEILTLIDIRGLLNLPLMAMANASKAMVVEVEGIVAGLMVEEVCDVMFSLNPREIIPITTATHSIKDKYLQGTAPYHEKIMSILDLPKMFLNGGLIVDEVI